MFKEEKDKLLSIGQIAELFDMNVKTIRYYESVGLLKPEYINEETGYRYYSTKQFERINTIKYLRALDVPIVKIKFFFEKREKTYQQLPGGNYVVIRFNGTHKDSEKYYQKIFDYMEEHDYKLAGDSVEITLIDYGFTDDVSQYVTEIQVPYEK